MKPRRSIIAIALRQYNEDVLYKLAGVNKFNLHFANATSFFYRAWRMGGEAWIALHPIRSRKKKAHWSPDSFDRP
jgi:hypothetical protein